MDGQSAKMLQLVLCCLFWFKESTQVYNKDVFMLQVILDQCFINSSKKNTWMFNAFGKIHAGFEMS